MYVPLENLAPTEKFNFCTWRNQHSWPTPSCLLLPEIRISKQDQVTWLTKICVHLGSLSNGTFNKVIPWNQHLEWFISFFFYIHAMAMQEGHVCDQPWRPLFHNVGEGFWWPESLRKNNTYKGSVWKFIALKSSAELYFEKKSSESYLWIWRSLPQNI